jgi:hypothetical protein
MIRFFLMSMKTAEQRFRKRVQPVGNGKRVAATACGNRVAL